MSFIEVAHWPCRFLSPSLRVSLPVHDSDPILEEAVVAGALVVAGSWMRETPVSCLRFEVILLLFSGRCAPVIPAGSTVAL